MDEPLRESPSQWRLLLASRGLGALREFIGQRARGLRVAFVPTAADAIDPSMLLEDLGLIVMPLELDTAAREEVQSTLQDADVVFVEGGNVFYLLHHAQRSGFAEMLPTFLDGGRCAYVGVSAGAVILGPDVWPASQIGWERVPALDSTKGLGLVDFVVISHHDDPTRKKVHADRVVEFGRRHHLVFLDDDQAIEVEGHDWRLVYSP